MYYANTNTKTNTARELDSHVVGEVSKVLYTMALYIANVLGL
jgi:hypothetical protein